MSPHVQLFIITSPHSLSRSETLHTWTLLAPATRQPSTFVSATHAVCPYLPPFPVTVWPPPFSNFGLRLSPCQYLWGMPVAGPYVSPVPHHCSPLVLLQILASCSSFCLFRVGFCTRERGQGASTPWQPLSLVLAPLTIWSFRCRSR